MALKQRIAAVEQTEGAYTYCPVIIIGAGASGLATACRLKQRYRFNEFRIFDRQAGIGGTWWINRYPGVACDIPTVSYSFSFAPNFTSRNTYPTGLEFVDYLRRVAKDHQIGNIELNTDITSIRYIEDDGEWELQATVLAPGTGDLSSRDRQKHAQTKGKQSVYLRKSVFRAKLIFSCLGILVEPNSWPDEIKGVDIFEGQVLHSARWKDTDVRDKDVAVIGTGASAAQIVPALLKEPFNARSVTQVMRTPP